MSPLRRRVLRADAIFLLIASIAALQADIVGMAFGLGPQGPFLGSTPQAAIGFIEAHGLALIIGVLLWRATPTRSWHLTAAAVHALLGGANLAFWPFFAAADMVAVGWVTTLLHGLFVALQLAVVEVRGSMHAAHAVGLHELDDRALRDIGLTRSELSSVEAELSGRAEPTRSAVLHTLGR